MDFGVGIPLSSEEIFAWIFLFRSKGTKWILWRKNRAGIFREDGGRRGGQPPAPQEEGGDARPGGPEKGK